MKRKKTKPEPNPYDSYTWQMLVDSRLENYELTAQRDLANSISIATLRMLQKHAGHKKEVQEFFSKKIFPL